ncbi:hypothetical protein L1987_62693 [Smallanthus sonchifolius]|uniref:Uncharacterized protein n=1 Tax=Smallanthus sonchifolius TaxID=185202 RepID=A0ACB9CBA7_9ASTR|nr:hypothetical protein L1987_62693 [Smallanthus sonchifolius]
MRVGTASKLDSSLPGSSGAGLPNQCINGGIIPILNPTHPGGSLSSETGAPLCNNESVSVSHLGPAKEVGSDPFGLHELIFNIGAQSKKKRKASKSPPKAKSASRASPIQVISRKRQKERQYSPFVELNQEDKIGDVESENSSGGDYGFQGSQVGGHMAGDTHVGEFFDHSLRQIEEMEVNINNCRGEEHTLST